jgi:ABC-type transport system substrate-binding protein
VTFHDGTPLSGEIAAASLRYANPLWTVTAENDTVVIDCKTPNPKLLAELSLARNSIVRRDAGKGVDGTGPFSIVEWQPGTTLKLAAEGTYWGGRPFVDSVEISMGRDYRDEMTALQLGRADLIELAPEQAQRVSQQGARVASSAPMELLAIVFSREVGSPEEKLLREALALSVERESIRSVLLQGVGQPAGSLLPTWMSGYGFVFSASADLAKARQLRSQVHNVPTWKMGYDPSDTMSRLLAERIALNARDAGLSLQPTSAATADMRLMRIPLASFNPWIALDELSAPIGVPAAKTNGGAVEELYTAEQAALATERLIPLFHLPVTYASAPRLRNWSVGADGGWDLADAWLEAATP